MAKGRQNGTGRESRETKNGGAPPDRPSRGGSKRQTLRQGPPAEREEDLQPPSSTSAPVRAWLDANQAPAPGSGRDPFRIPTELVTQHTDPGLLAEKPLESGGL